MWWKARPRAFLSSFSDCPPCTRLDRNINVSLCPLYSLQCTSYNRAYTSVIEIAFFVTLSFESSLYCFGKGIAGVLLFSQDALLVYICTISFKTIQRIIQLIFVAFFVLKIILNLCFFCLILFAPLCGFFVAPMCVSVFALNCSICSVLVFSS